MYKQICLEFGEFTNINRFDYNHFFFKTIALKCEADGISPIPPAHYPPNPHPHGKPKEYHGVNSDDPNDPKNYEGTNEKNTHIFYGPDGR